MTIFEERTQCARQLMAEKGIDVMLVLSLENYYYFTGDYRRQSRSLLPRDSDPILLVSQGEAEEARSQSWISDVRGYGHMHEMMLTIINVLKERGLSTGKLAVEMEFATPAFLLERFKLANPTVQVVDSKPITSPLRLVKSPDELELIRKAAALADLGMETAIKSIKPGVTEIEVAAEAEYAMKKAGAERVAFPIFVNSGPRSQWLHGLATYRRIKRGDPVLIDIGPVYHGYCADICRSLVVGGGATEEQRKVYDTYRAAQDSVLEMLGPGKRGMDIDQLASRVVTEHGYGKYYVRGFAHGVGLGFEETPFPTIFPEDTVVELPANAVLACGHPTLAVPGVGGFRVEDTVVLTTEGADVLTKYPKEWE
ncbi:MAG: Xaa-Pro peptidase family protein [Actinobacteria bacterium]|nr:Xaa-Pro peptidase family protein [Actinomycetota bacterium]